MIYYINEHQYYTMVEDQIYNHSVPAVLLFTKDCDDESRNMINRFESLSNETKVEIYCLDEQEGSEILNELVSDLSRDVNIPVAILFDGGDHDNFKVFDYSDDINELVEEIRSL